LLGAFTNPDRHDHRSRPTPLVTHDPNRGRLLGRCLPVLRRLQLAVQQQDRIGSVPERQVVDRVGAERRAVAAREVATWDKGDDCPMRSAGCEVRRRLSRVVAEGIQHSPDASKEGRQIVAGSCAEDLEVD